MDKRILARIKKRPTLRRPLFSCSLQWLPQGTIVIRLVDVLMSFLLGNYFIYQNTWSKYALSRNKYGSLLSFLPQVSHFLSTFPLFFQRERRCCVHSCHMSLSYVPVAAEVRFDQRAVLDLDQVVHLLPDSRLLLPAGSCEVSDRHFSSFLASNAKSVSFSDYSHMHTCHFAVLSRSDCGF